MTHRWLSLSILTCLLALPALAPAQVDFDEIRNGVAGCPEIAADPAVGSLGAFLCRPFDRTILDLPTNHTGNKFWEVRAGSFHPFTRPSLTAAARQSIGNDEFARLQTLLIHGQVLSRSQSALRLALLAEAAEARAGGDDAAADALAAQTAAILATPDSVFDANIPALLATRPDRDRYADLRSGLLHSLGARDTFSQYAPAFGESLVASLGGLPIAVDADGLSVYTADNARNRANPFFLGPDGLRDTADDLPFVLNNERAAAAGYLLDVPLQGPIGTPENLLASFDGTFGRNSVGDAARPIYSQTAQVFVPSASDPSALKLVELYGVYSDAYLINQGCGGGFGTYNTATGECFRSGIDASAEALARGCGVIVRTRGVQLNVGVNADGSCIEVNTASPAVNSQLQFEVLGLLGDLAARPLEASQEPVDLTDLRVVADGGALNTLPARPRAPTGSVSFLTLASTFRRSVDPSTGAPLASGGSECHIRVNGVGQAIGPNGLAGDGDDLFPSVGDCTLWDPPIGDFAQALRSPASIAFLHSANQSLFHTLCTVSFDAEKGSCTLDELNYPFELGLLSNILSGLGVLGSVVLDGVETIQPVGAGGRASVIQRGSNFVMNRMVLPIEPLALQSLSFQDLGVSLRPAQSALLGCGQAYASPCSSSQQTTWRANPAIFADLTRDPALGPSSAAGIDLMNADASVLLQEFAVLKQRSAGSLVGATRNDSGQLVYLPGVDFSRNGQQNMNVDADFTRQGQQINPPGGVSHIESAGQFLTLTPSDVIDLGTAGRAEYQIQPGDLREADAWIESMPWTVNQELLAKYGAIVFNTDPSNVLDLDSPLNQWNLIGGGSGQPVQYSDIDGEYCARWMNASDSSIATPFNLGCTGLETISANLERLRISREVIGQDRVFDAPESLAELVAMLDGDPSNDATGDPIAGPDGIFARNQFVISDEQMDFDVLAAGQPFFDSTLVPVVVDAGESAKEAASRTLLTYDPQASCQSSFCYLQVDNVLTDPDDAPSQGRSLILAMPIGASLQVVVPISDPQDPNDAISGYEPSGFDMKVNLAKLQLVDLPTLRLLMASQVVAIETPAGSQFVQMNNEQRNQLLGELGSQTQRGRDMDGDQSSDLDRNRDGIWDGQDDYLPGPVSDDSILCGSGILGDLLQDGVQFRSYRADERPGQASFTALFPDGLPPRSPVFCRELTALLGLVGPLPDAVPGQSDAFLWHGGMSAPGADDDADGFPTVVDNCATVANADQADFDIDGVGSSCDNCAQFPNPRVPRDFLATNPWATLTGGQRDDDHDGFGNLCDADFDNSSTTNGDDTAQYKASIGKPVAADVCGTSGDRACAIFDLEPRGKGISAADSRRFRELLGNSPGPACATCPLACESGEPANCD